MRPSPRLRAKVRWGVNFRRSGGKSRAIICASTSPARCPRASDATPAHNTRGARLFGKKPTPEIETLKAAPRILARLSSMAPNRGGDTSPRNFNVRCIDSGRTHRSLLVWGSSSPRISDKDRTTGAGKSIATNRRMLRAFQDTVAPCPMRPETIANGLCRARLEIRIEGVWYLRVPTRPHVRCRPVFPVCPHRDPQCL